MTTKAIRRAFAEFLTVPTSIIAGFLLLSIGAVAVEQSTLPGVVAVRRALADHGFGDAEATSQVLGGIAAGLITVTSITFSLLLLAVQQSAAALSSQVFDQFLRRRLNQVFFGYFVGLALYALLVLATIRPDFNPILGAALAVLLTSVALYFLVLLIYMTIDQARPAVVVKAIHDHTLAARDRQLPLIRQTRRAPLLRGAAVPVHAGDHGFVVGIDIAAIRAAIGDNQHDTEVVLNLAIGSFVAFGDPLAEITAPAGRSVDALAATVRGAIALDRIRDLDVDPVYGIHQLMTVAWRSVSTSQQNPAPGLLVVDMLRDLLARWSAESDDPDPPPDDPPAPVVYQDDLFPELLDAFESIAVVASESMQHQTCAAVVRVLATMFDRLPPDHQPRAEDLVRRLLSGLGDHVLTAKLESALTALADTLSAAGSPETAAAVRVAPAKLSLSVGELNSRATRVPSG